MSQGCWQWRPQSSQHNDHHGHDLQNWWLSSCLRKSASIQNDVSHSHCIPFYFWCVWTNDKFTMRKRGTTPFHIFCSRVTGDQGKIWTRILACCQLWSQFLRFFTSTAQPYFKDAQVKSLQENGQIGGEGGFWWKRKLISNLARQVEGFRRCQEVENCRGGCQFALRNA